MLQKILHLFKRKQVIPHLSMGKGSVLKGKIVKLRESSEVSIGNHSLIEGTITAYMKDSKISIGNHTFVGHNTLIGCCKHIEIGDHVLISFDCILQDSDTHHIDYRKRKNDTAQWMNGKKDWDGIPIAPIKIGDDAWIGARSIILKGVTIGEGAIVGAGSVVTRDVEPFTLVAGNPARFIRNLEH